MLMSDACLPRIVMEINLLDIAKRRMNKSAAIYPANKTLRQEEYHPPTTTLSRSQEANGPPEVSRYFTHFALSKRLNHPLLPLAFPPVVMQSR